MSVRQPPASACGTVHQRENRTRRIETIALIPDPPIFDIALLDLSTSILQQLPVCGNRRKEVVELLFLAESEVVELLDLVAVLLGREQLLEFALVGKFDFYQPAVAVGVVVDQFRHVNEVLVRGGDLARDRGVEV